ncbi:MAG: ABC transporter permease [Candidatus Kariarchaeaceae archaeon]|jgi:ABC-type transport system involved in multi-copper enzyme maturation permease subunit
MSRLQSIFKSISLPISRETLGIPQYGRCIPIISQELFRSTIREKRFYLAVFYYNIIPIAIILFSSTQPVVQSGTGIALFYAQRNTMLFIKSIFLSFFLGQILLVLLTADQISGEVEQETFPLLRSKPVYDSEIILGKFIGMIALILILNLPTIIFAYTANLIRYNAEFPMAYIETIDEVVGGIIILILLQSLIISFTLITSAIFSRSLYAILSSLISIFILSSISGSLGSKNYLSFEWLLDATLPSVFYHLEPLEAAIPHVMVFIGAITGIITLFLMVAILILRKKELL